MEHGNVRVRVLPGAPLDLTPMSSWWYVGLYRDAA
jgi:hypothetical protein